MTTTRAGVIEVFADLACPFTHVGLRRIAERRDQLGRDDVLLRVRAWPLELVNDAPFDPHQIAPRIAAIRAQVAPDLFEGFDVETFPRSCLDALALEAAAGRRDAKTGEAVSFELRDLLYEHGVDISSAEVLTEVAERHGIDAGDISVAAVHQDFAEGRDRGVVGSPHYFTSTADFFCPSLSISRDEAGALLIRRDLERFEAFMEASFG